MSSAFSTKFSILLTVDSPNSLFTWILNTPVWFINPLKTLSPVFAFLGTDSPVNAVVSSIDSPSITLPSRGIFSPGFTIIISPTFTSSGLTFNSAFSLKTFAKSGLIFIKFSIDFLELSTA